MMDFSLEKNGYKKSEVDEYISANSIDSEKVLQEKDAIIKDLIEKNQGLETSLSSYKSKKDSISSAFVVAVDKAKQIEESSKNVYKLKLQQLNILYRKWEQLLDEMIDKYPKLTETKKIKNMVSSFENSIKTILKNDYNFAGSEEVGTSSDPIRNLLSKVSLYAKEESVEQKNEIKLPRKDTALEANIKFEERPINLKPIADIKLDKNESYGSLLDKFLSTEDEPDNAFADKFKPKQKISNEDADPYAFPEVNESGFNLEEAINPKDDLDTIMKSFDFFADDDDNPSACSKKK